MTKTSPRYGIKYPAPHARNQHLSIGQIIGTIEAFGATFNPLRFGAVGDGTTDDTDAINAALDAASSAGLPLDLAGQSYKITSDVTWPSGVRIQNGHFAMVGCGITLSNQAHTEARDFTFERTGAAGAALAMTGDAGGIRRLYFDNVRCTGSTGDGVTVSGAWLFTWINPYINACAGNGLTLEDGAFSTGLNALTLVGGELQGCDIGLMLDKCKHVNIIGTAIEGNRIGIGLGASVLSLSVLSYFEANTDGHIVGVEHSSGSGSAAGLTIKSGTCFQRNSGSDYTVIDASAVRQLIVEDGVQALGYSAADTPLITVADVGDSSRAEGYLGLMRTDAPAAYVLDNGCYYFGRRTERNWHTSITTSDSADTPITPFPTGYAGNAAQPNASTRARFQIHLDVTTGGDVVLVFRGRDASGTIVAANRIVTATVTAGYNCIANTSNNDWSDDVAYIEVYRSGSSVSDTAEGIDIIGVDLITYENRLQDA